MSNDANIEKNDQVVEILQTFYLALLGGVNTNVTGDADEFSKRLLSLLISRMGKLVERKIPGGKSTDKVQSILEELLASPTLVCPLITTCKPFISTNPDSITINVTKCSISGNQQSMCEISKLLLEHYMQKIGDKHYVNINYEIHNEGCCINAGVKSYIDDGIEVM